MSEVTKPVAVVYIAIFYFIVAAVFVFGAYICLTPSMPGPTIANDVWTNFVIKIPVAGGIIEDLLGSLFLSNIPLWGILAIVIAAIDAVAAILLLKLSSFGRILTIIMAIPMCVAVIGIIIIWVLCKDDVKDAFVKASLLK